MNAPAGPNRRMPLTAAGPAPRQETTVAINEALAALDELDRDVFLMREVAGLRYDEIAQACDLTDRRGAARIHRTRLRLRDHLKASIDDVRAGPLRFTGASQ